MIPYTVCCADIKFGRTSFNLSERSFGIVFKSAFKRKWPSSYL